MSFDYSLTLTAVPGKLVCGYVAFGTQANKFAIGAGMVPRGEVGLIFYQCGFGHGCHIGEQPYRRRDHGHPDHISRTCAAELGAEV